MWFLTKLIEKELLMADVILTQELLMSQLNYNLDTGLFTRLVSNNPNAKVGDTAGSVNNKGYAEAKSKIHTFNPVLRES